MRVSLTCTLFFVVVLVAAPASAYTLVLRTGERVDVGEAYRIVGGTFEFRFANSIHSMPLNSLDLDATARLNRESVASFVDRATSRQEAPAPTRPRQVIAPPPGSTPNDSQGAAITVTSKDLDQFRMEREQADADYYSRHPNIQTAAPDTIPEALPTGFTPNDENDWRAQASEIREKLDVEQAQIDELQGEIDFRNANPRDFRLSYRYNYGNTPIYRTPNGVYYSPFGNGSGYLRADEEFAQLNSRLIDIQIEHRATLARWDFFVERARRAGVPPGWIY